MMTRYVLLVVLSVGLAKTLPCNVRCNSTGIRLTCTVGYVPAVDLNLIWPPAARSIRCKPY